MATAKKPLKKPTPKKASTVRKTANSRSTAVAARPAAKNYSEVTTLLLAIWLVLIAVFVGMVIYKVYTN